MNQSPDSPERPNADGPEGELDQLLKLAVWPEPGPETIARLESTVRSAMNEAQESAELPSTVTFSRSATSVRNPGTRGAQQSAGSSFVTVTVIAASMLAAFWCGRWTGVRQRPHQPGISLPTAATDDRDRDSGGLASAASNGDSTLMKPADDVTSRSKLAMAPLDGTSQPQVSADVATMSPTPKTPVPEIGGHGAATPVADPLMSRRSRLSEREQLQRKLDSVLTCLEKEQSAGAVCCRELLPNRAQFEFLLAEVMQNATGQRRLAAVTAMGFVGTDRSVPMLVQSATAAELRTASIAAVKRCASENMLAGLILQGGDRQVMAELAKELAGRTSRQAATVWLHLVRTPASRDLCLELTDELSEPIVSQLFQDLDAPLMDDRLAAILTLGRRSDQATLERVLGLCRQFPSRWEPVAILMWNGSETSLKSLAVIQRNPERFAVLESAAIQLKSFVGPTSDPAKHIR